MLSDTTDSLGRSLLAPTLKSNLISVALRLDDCLLRLKLWQHDVRLDIDLENFGYESHLSLMDILALEHLQQYAALIEKMLSADGSDVLIVHEEPINSTVKLFERLVLSFTEDTSAHRLLWSSDDQIDDLRRVLASSEQDTPTVEGSRAAHSPARSGFERLDRHLFDIHDIDDNTRDRVQKLIQDYEQKLEAYESKLRKQYEQIKALDRRLSDLNSRRVPTPIPQAWRLTPAAKYAGNKSQEQSGSKTWLSPRGVYGRPMHVWEMYKEDR